MRLDICPSCGLEMKFIGHYAQISEFYKCKDGCKRLWEVMFDATEQNYKYVDVYVMLSRIREESRAM